MLDDEQQRIYDMIVAGPRGRVEGPLETWLESPQLAEKAQELGAFCRFGTSLPPRLSELAILVVGAWWQADFEWYVHAPIARSAGISDEVIEAIRTGRPPDFEREDEAAVHGFTFELLRYRRVSDASHDRVVGLLGRRGAIELTAMLGYYTLISMTIVGFDVPLPGGAPSPFADIALKVHK
ncbi:carboxymuconolactone decarboxylase family protein [Rhizorhabdus wittichii]|uniref:Carboxymuconolactone decarboxylase family protein n=2 Tax=Rhizorhabdus wittichii TaxID=160791 RepID=A0A975D8H5_9SPHN|nr:carboxymuconolactone decarboxylase family protein [Rhizorhabdus wittichii]